MPRIRGEAPDSDLIQSADYVDPFEVITDEDRDRASQEMAKEILQYAGYTFLIVFILLLLVACFASDPRACIVACGTGSPCCLLCPCVRNLYKYTNPTKLIQDSANTYVPGVIVEDDGTLKAYEPSEEEIEALFDLISTVSTML